METHENKSADDWPRPYMRDGVPGLPIERQEEMLRAAGLDMEQAFIDRLTKSAIRKRDPASLKERADLLRPTARRTTEIIYIAGLRVLGWNIGDICHSLLAAARRRARVHCLDTGTTYSADMPGIALLEALADAEDAHRRGRAKALRSAGVEAARKAKQRRNAPKLALARELWLKPVGEISVAGIAERVGLSPRTLYQHLGPRAAAREGATKRKSHA